MRTNLFSVLAYSMLFFLALGGCSREKPGGAVPSKYKGIVEVTTVLATVGPDEKPRPVSIPSMHLTRHEQQDQPTSFDVTFSESGTGVAYIVGKRDKAYVVHNNSRGKEYSVLGKVVLSSDGGHVAYGALADGKWRMVVDDKEGSPFSTVNAPVFSPDGKHVAYHAMKGERWYIVFDNSLHDSTAAHYSRLEFNADSNMIAYLENQANKTVSRLIINNLRSGRRTIKESIGKLLISNTDKTRLAATQVIDNKVRVIDFSFADPDIVNEGRLYDEVDLLTFGNDGVSVSYFAVKGGTRMLVLNNREEALPDGELTEPPVIRPDKKGASIFLGSQNGFFLHRAFINSTEKEKVYHWASYLAYTSDSRLYAYAAQNGKNGFVVVKGKEGPAFDRVVSPVFSPDGKLLVYRARKDGKRFVVVADANGRTIRRHPSYEQVFQPVFTADGKSIAYGVKDGDKLICKVEKLP